MIKDLYGSAITMRPSASFPTLGVILSTVVTGKVTLESTHSQNVVACSASSALPAYDNRRAFNLRPFSTTLSSDMTTRGSLRSNNPPTSAVQIFSAPAGCIRVG